MRNFSRAAQPRQAGSTWQLQRFVLRRERREERRRGGEEEEEEEEELTWDFAPAPSTARVTERAQQITWILKKDPKKLLQPRASISCGDVENVHQNGQLPFLLTHGKRAGA